MRVSQAASQLIGVVSYIVSGAIVLVANGVAYAEGLNLGAGATTATVVAGVLLGLLIKSYADFRKAKTAAQVELDKAVAGGIIAKAEAEANANAYRERLEMKIQEEWDAVNAHTLKGQLTQLQQQNTKLQATIEEDRESTDKARETLHAIRKEFNIATLEHREQREALIAELGAVRGELTKARQDVAEFQRREQARLNTVVVGQARQDVKIEENTVANAENKAAIQAIAEKSGPMPVVKVDEPERPKHE